MKQIDFSPRSKLKKGLDQVADAVKITIGPKGRNVILDRGEPLITNDGGTIAAEIQLKDKVENMGAQIIRGVIRKTSEKVGGGRTASAILTQSIVTEGLKQIENGMNITLLKKGMLNASQDIITNLTKNAKEVSSNDQIQQIATISTESSELGSIIATVIGKVGKDCLVTVEESQSFGIESEVVDGMKFDKGYISPYMVTDPERMEAEFKNISVLVTDKEISVFKEIYPVIKKLADSGKNSLLLVCEDFKDDALNQTVMMKLAKAFNLLAVKAPGFQDKSDWLEDIATACNTQVVSDKTGVKMDTELGLANKVISTKDSTILMGSNDTTEQVSKIQAQLDNTENQWDKDRLQRRLATLKGSIAVIKVGAATESELKYLKQKIEDGVNESKRALEEGIVIGGDCAFIQAAKELEESSGLNEEGKGYNIVLKAIEAPLRQIVINGNGKPDVIINELKQTKSQVAGYNCLTNKIEPDMFKAGIIDALKVARTALENAISGASMFLTIETSISEEVEDGKRNKYEY